MADATPSLWQYSSPDAYRIAQQKAMQDAADAYAAKTQQQRTDAAGYMAGASLRQGLNSLFGVEDKGLQQVKQFQEIMQGVNRQDPNSIFAAAKKLQDIGHPAADQVIAVGESVAAKLSKLAEEKAKATADTARAERETAMAEKALADARAKDREDGLKNLPPEIQAILLMEKRDPTFDAKGAMAEYLKRQGTAQWSEPFQMGGATVQKNTKTGEIRTAVSRPPVTHITTNPASTMPDTAIDMLANQYLQTGTLPPLGMGKDSGMLRAAILTRASELGGKDGTIPPEQVATNVRDAKANTAAAAATMKDFGSGMSARKVTANNTAINHLETMSNLANDLGNSDVRIFNSAANALAAATGSPAPTSFDAARQLVASEVIKAVVANGGGVTERQEAADQFARANSPKQLQAVINTYKELLAGQLSSLEQQYESGSGRKDFKNRLSPATRKLLEKPEAAQSKTKEQEWNDAWSKLPKGKTMVGLDGKTYTKN